MMFKKLLSWCSKGVAGTTYQTTLADDLYEVSLFLGESFPYVEAGVNNFHKKSTTVSFFTDGHSERNIRQKIKMKSLKLKEGWDNIKSFYWEADLDEFEATYESPYHHFSEILRALSYRIQEVAHEEKYRYILDKYEDSILIVKNVLETEKEVNNGHISEEAFEHVKEIIARVGRAVVKKQKELEKLEKLEIKAVLRGNVETLKSEIEFIDKYLEIS